MFRRHGHDKAPVTKMVSPTEGRPLSYRNPESKDNNERQVRVMARYTTEDGAGVEQNTTELIWGKTETQAGTLTKAQIFELLGGSMNVIAEQTSPRAAFSGVCLVEYPREKASEPIDAILLMTGRAGRLSKYTIKEVTHEGKVQVLVLGCEPDLADDAVIERPVGARITTSVRGSIPANGYPAPEQVETTFEEDLFEEMRRAVSDYNETRSE